jgi:hypothetical protein
VSDIVERLNNANLDGTGSVKIDMLCVEASDEIVRLRGERDEMERRARAFEAGATNLQAERDRLRDALALYREAVVIDVKMEGPRFMGANSSALKRAWDYDRAALGDKP